MDTVYDSVPDSVADVLDDLMIAKIYNTVVGASVTHRDVAEWGMIEKEAVQAALQLI